MLREQVLVTLPSAMTAPFGELEKRGEGTFACHDPNDPVGSGGGTAHILYRAWQHYAPEKPFRAWLNESRKVIIHSGGQSRRLPAYAAVGKTLMPIAVERGSVGQRFDQSLLDLQLDSIQPILSQAPDDLKVVVLSGDAMTRLGEVPKSWTPADVVCLGFAAPPEEIQYFGAFFMSWDQPDRLDFVRQKPNPAETNDLIRSHRALADAGVWLLNEKATVELMSLCGWEESTGRFAQDTVKEFDLYSEFGLALGDHPTQTIPGMQPLSCSVIQPSCEFFHFGTSRQLIEAVTRLHNREVAQVNGKLGFTTTARRHNNLHVQNVRFNPAPDLPVGEAVWIENAYIPASLKFTGDNVLTGLPVNEWAFTFPRGACLEVVPVAESAYCLRAYGFDDAFKGAIGKDSTEWMGGPASRWFAERGISLEEAGINPGIDLQEAALFPVVETLDSGLAAWMLGTETGDAYKAQWLSAKRLSARQLLTETNVARIYAQRAVFRQDALHAVVKNRDRSVFYTMDLEHAAELISPGPMEWDAYPAAPDASPAQMIRDRMFRSALLRQRGDDRWETLAAEAFNVLRKVIVDPERLAVSRPVSSLMPQQIIWGRSPLRLDLAGGWTDTPPYSLLYGGRVVNVAVELNGQPPVQVFGRVTDTPEIVLRSIDIGTETHIREYEELSTSIKVGSEFALAKTALSLAGFIPEFCREPEPTLRQQLEAFGGGIELSMLAAVPKGSGLGTSSVLSAAILATVGAMCSHAWTHQDVFTRVLASEQLLTTGGGWQDQAGGSLSGLKLLKTEPGIVQNIGCHWLPDSVLSGQHANVTALLYYTGVTRTAKDVLGEIVRGMFLNSKDRVATLRAIGENTEPTVDAILRNSFEDLGRCVRRSWELNQRLDSGTCPPKIAHIVSLIDDYLIGTKLLGAGGGGYMLMLCKDAEAATRVRKVLTEEHQEPGSRFVDYRVSTTGLEVTRS